ncbi:MAG: hypothetical protein HOP25_01355 [Methylotenera sp.]|nr:hypothetical protein [Methylotenera sp.]
MNTERDKVRAALIEVTSGSRRNKTARLRDYYDWVMEAKAAGASNKVLVNALTKNGLIFDIDTFKHALHRIKKERVIDALVNIPFVQKDRRFTESISKPQFDNDTTDSGTNKTRQTTQTPPKSADKLGQAEGVASAVDLTNQTLANKQDTSKYNAD